ncbi:hypothetical protein NE237_021533 [Protea cynaroides]|uniref:NYN domain-containing protein n=1 Tax=Protea cynaroides TaxID=273540 RepID=A0A9Q0K4Y9_9MAGN|nr:hypothetical protein NE237_021533 [Protea cynaroides]
MASPTPIFGMESYWKPIICGKEGMEPQGPVAIFWDIENCNVPRGIDAENVSGNVRKALSEVDIKCIKNFTAYGDCNELPKQVRAALQLTGVNVVDVPHVKDGAADRAILNDTHLFASDNPPSATLVLISGDVDFAETLHKLGQRGHTIILLIPFGVGVSSALLNAAEFVLDWPSAARGEGFVSRKPLMPSELKSITESPTSNAWANTSPFYPYSYDMPNPYGMYKPYVDPFDVAFWDHSPRTSIWDQFMVSAGPSTGGQYNDSARTSSVGRYVSAGPVTWGHHNDSVGTSTSGQYVSADPFLWGQHNDSAGSPTWGRHNVSSGSPTWGRHNVSAGSFTCGQYNDLADSAGPSAWERYDARGKGKKCSKL